MLALWLPLLAVFFLLTATVARRKFKGDQPSPAEKQLPLAEPRLPVLGSAVAFGKDPVNFVVGCIKKYGNMFYLRLGGMQQIVVHGPELTKLLFKHDDSVLSMNEALKAMNFGIFMDESTFSFPLHITLLKTRFTPNMKRWTDLMLGVNTMEYFEQQLDKHGTLDWRRGKEGRMVMNLEQLTAEMVARSSARCMCGSEGYQHDELISTFVNFDRDASDVVGMSMILPRVLHRFLGGKMKHHFNVMRKYLTPIVKKRRADPSLMEEDFLGYIMDSTDENGKPLDDDFIVHRMGLVIWASMTTTSVALYQTCIEVFSRPDIKQKVLEEQHRLIGVSPTIEHEHIKKMDYLEACIRESLRLTAPVLGACRLAMTDIQAGEYSIPKGTIVGVSAMAAHHDPAIWGEDVEEFKPERFLHDKNPRPNGFLPFGGGYHHCPGQYFAFNEMKTILAALLRHYDIDIPGGRPPHIYNGNKYSFKQVPVIFTKLTEPDSQRHP